MTSLRSIVGRLLGPLLNLRLMSLRPAKNRMLRYFVTALAGSLVIWVAALLIVACSSSVYTSRWTVILPGSGSEASLFLQGIGQASSNSASPYASVAHSPRVNYREIVTSQTVLQLAAEIAEMSPSKFGQPRVKLVQQSSLMSLSISGDSADQAYAKAASINAALQTTLDRLRSDEMALRESGMRSAMESYSQRMSMARAALLEHQTSTQLITADQLDELIFSVENLERKLIEVTAEADQQVSYLKTLARSLNVSEELAAAAVILHADEATRRLIADYADAQTVINGKRGVFGPNHPRMLAARSKSVSVEANFRRRAFELLGRSDIDVRRLVMLDVEDATGGLFRELVLNAATLEGTQAKQRALERELANLRERLRAQVGGVAKLADLERDHKIAEAVFSSALARMDTNKADLFVSYPLIQTIVEPNRPAEADKRPALFVVAGAATASVCFYVGLILLWLRTPPCRPALKR